MIATATPRMTNAQMHTENMDITPDRASRWLEGNTHNRPINQAHVNRLAEDMKAGRWRSTHQGIAFDVNGVLRDGQHRLWAIVMSGCTIRMPVTFNLRVDAIDQIDTILTRSVHDRMTLTGRFGDNGVTAYQLAVLRAIVRGTSAGRRMPFETECNQMATHRRAIEFAISHLATNRIKGVSSGVTCAAVARAWYSVDLDKLARFCEVLRTSVARGDDEKIIIALRDQLTNLGRGEYVANYHEIYGKVERALYCYLSGKPSGTLRPCQTEMFLLPGEEVKAA